MRIIISAVILFLAASMASPACAKPVKVKGSIVKNGTYRKNHTRSSPNKSRLDNYGTRGRINPRTGKPGKKEPFRR
jgi:hypothetical protein